MKINVYADEWYPYYIIVDNKDMGSEINVSREKIREWKRIYKKVNKMQKEIREIIKKEIKNGARRLKMGHRLENREKPKIKLVGEDGNAFFIMGRVAGALKKAGYSK